MDKRMMMAIALGLAAGMVGGILTGYGTTYSLNPAPPAPPQTYTLTIVNFRTNVAEIKWTPDNAGVNFTVNMEEIVSITFEANTNVTLEALGDIIGSFSGPDAADVQVVKPYRSWILMDSDKIIQIVWL